MSQQQQQQKEQKALSIAALSAATLAASPLAAIAEEAATATGDEGFKISLLLGAAPLAVYGVFYGYREFVNPRAKISDALYFLAAGVILANIVSILVFHVRFF